MDYISSELTTERRREVKGRFSREQMRAELLNRTRESYEAKDRGIRTQSVLKPELGIPTWWASEGLHLIDIIPFYTSEDGLHPDPKVKPGALDYRWEGWLHRFIGPSDQDFVCPLFTFYQGHKLRGPCPICERRRALLEEGADQKLVNSLRPTRYCLYNVLVYSGQGLADRKEVEDRGIHVWAVSHFQFEREIISIAQKAKGGGQILFVSPDKELGKSIRFERRGTGRDNTQYIGYAFEDRDYDIPDEVLDSAYCLDEVIYVASYDEIAEAFFASTKVEPAVGTAVDVDSEPETPPAASTRFSRVLSKMRPEETEESVPTPEPAPSRASKPSVSPGKCPAGAEFGSDIDQLDACEDCAQYDRCAERADEIEEERRKRQLHRVSPRSNVREKTEEAPGAGRRRL